MRRFIYVGVLCLFLAALLLGTSRALARSYSVIEDPASFHFGTVWAQINSDGFGNSDNNTIGSLAGFKGAVYAGTGNSDGAQLWRNDPDGWHQVMSGGFGNEHNTGIDTLIGYNGYLYAGTANFIDDTTSDGGEIWRSLTGDAGAWTQVVTHGSGTGTADPSNFEFFYFFTLNTPPDHICAATYTDTSVHGAEIWCSADGVTNWTKWVSNGFGDASISGIYSSAEHNGALYFATGAFSGGGKVYRTDLSLGSPTQVNDPGFGLPENVLVSSLAAYHGYLYAATHHSTGGGLQVYRCQTCNANADWTKVVDNGFGNHFTRIMLVYHDQLYLVAGNLKTFAPFESQGMEVWETGDGAEYTWRQYVLGGFNDVNNWAPYYGNSLLAYHDLLYIGASNYETGSELWELLPLRTYIPIARK
jgi:hypothetical protein